MDAQLLLINILIFCGIILLITLTVGVIQLIVIMFDVRSTTKEVKTKVFAVTSVIDIVTTLMGGIDQTKKKARRGSSPERSTLTAFVAGLKKGVEVLFNKEEKD